MTTDCKLLFGLNHPGSGNVTLTISGGPGGVTMPDVTAEDTQAQITNGAYNTSTQSWSLTVGPGDYVVRLDLTTSQWFNGQLPISASTAVNFVYYGPLSSNTTVAWTATSVTGRGDPKDPWPPPAVPYVTMSTSSYNWHDAKLQTASAQLPKDIELGFDEPRSVATNL